MIYLIRKIELGIVILLAAIICVPLYLYAACAGIINYIIQEFIMNKCCYAIIVLVVMIIIASLSLMGLIF